MKNLYIVFTNNNLYLTLLKANFDLKTSGKRADLILTDAIINPMPKDMIDALRKLKLFDNIFIVNDDSLEDKITRGNKRLALFFYKYRVLKYVTQEFKRMGFHPFDTNYDKIFSFIESSYSTQFFLIKKRFIHLIEDGTDAYNEYTEDWHLKLRYFLGFPRRFGKSPYIQGYWVLRPNNMPEYLKDKVVHYNLSLYKKKLNKDFIQMMIDVFLPNGTSIIKDLQKSVTNKKTFLLLTQWFSELGIMNEAEKIEIYKKTINKYAKEDHTIVIKPHPQEKTNYAFHFPNSIIFPASIPMEIIADCCTFDMCVTIDSGSIVYTNCKEKIQTEDEFNEKGWEQYMKDFGYSKKRKVL